MKRKVKNGERVFKIDELDGFYIGDGLCVHITFEDEDTIAIDLFDTEEAAFKGNKGEIIGRPLILNLRNGEVNFE